MEHIFLLFFSFVIEAVILWQYSSGLFVPVRSGKIRLLTLCCLYAVLFLLSFCGFAWLNILSYFVLNALFFYTQFRLNILHSLFHSAVLAALMGLSELAFWGTFARFVPRISSRYLSAENALFFAVFNKILFFAIVHILIYCIKKKDIQQTPVHNFAILLVVVPVASLFVLETLLIISEKALPATPKYNLMVTLSSVFLLLCNVLIFSVYQYNQKKSMEFTELQLQLQRESDSAKYYEMLLSQHENQSILIHDIRKHLQSIAMLNEENEREKIDAYIRQLIVSSDLRESVRLCDNEILNAILSRFQKQCFDKDISFHADIRSGAVNHLEHHDMTALFCNLLDNAVEAAEHIPESFIEISVHKKEHTPFLVLVMINSCRAKPVTDRSGMPVSTKTGEGRHGFGLKSVQRVVDKHHGSMQMYYDEQEAAFHTIIMLKQPYQ